MVLTKQSSPGLNARRNVRLLTMILPPVHNARHRCAFLMLFSILLLSAACERRQAAERLDRPRLTPNVVCRDIMFHSAALNRDIEYRIILPSKVRAGEKLPTVYLLHGGGGGFRDWSNYSDVSRYAGSGLILVMPEGGSSYYTNAVDPPQDRYEDYITQDLIADVERRFPVAPGRANRAIVGLSMGGFGAVKIALRHPDLFAFVGGLSSAIDVPRRSFTIRRLHQSRHYNSIFGSNGSATRKENDPIILVRSANPDTAPYFFLTCGEQEGLLPSNREFADLLAQRHFHFEFHTMRGAHDWNQWNAWLPALFLRLAEHIPVKH